MVSFLFDELDAGEYTLNVSDHNHCAAKDLFTIKRDEDISQTLSIVENPAFGTSNGSFSISDAKQGGVLIPYSFEVRRNGLVLGSAVFQSADARSVVSNLSSGTYEVEVWNTGKLDRGCSSVTTFLLTENLDYQVKLESASDLKKEGESARVKLRLYTDGENGSPYENQFGIDVVVGISMRDISATKVVDYKNGSGLKYAQTSVEVDGCAIPENTYYAIIPKKSDSVVFYIDYLTDNVLEPEESFELMTTTILNASAIKTKTAGQSSEGVKVGIGNPFSAKMKIEDVREKALYVVFEPATGYGYEAKNMTKDASGKWVSSPPIENGWFEFSLRDADYNKVNAGEALDVYFHVDSSSTATLGADYRLMNDSIVTIPKGSSTGRAYIYVLEDNLIEGDETVVIMLDSVRTKTKTSAELGVLVGTEKSDMETKVSTLPGNYSNQAVVTILDDEVVTVTLPIDISIRPQSVKIYESDEDATRKAGLYLTILNQTHLLDRNILVTINMSGSAVCGLPTDAADAGDFYYEYVDTLDQKNGYISYVDDKRDQKEKDKRFKALFPEGSSDSPLFYINVNDDNWLEYHETEYLYLTPTIGDEDKIVYYTDYFTDPTTFVKTSIEISVRVVDSTVIQIVDDERSWLSMFSSATACSGTPVSHDKSLIKQMLKNKIVNIDNYDISYVYYPRDDNAEVDYSAQSCFDGCDGLFQQLTIPMGEADVPFDGVVTFTGIPYSAADHTEADDDADDCISTVGMRKLEQIKTNFNMTIHVVALPRLQFGDDKLK